MVTVKFSSLSITLIIMTVDGLGIYSLVDVLNTRGGSPFSPYLEIYDYYRE